MPETVVQTVWTVEAVGSTLCQRFVDDHMRNNIVNISHTTTKNNLLLSSCSSGKSKRVTPNMTTAEICKSILQNVLWMVTWIIYFDMRIMHGLLWHPIMWCLQPLNLMDCLEPLVTPLQEVPVVGVKIVDDASFVHRLGPRKSTNSILW